MTGRESLPATLLVGAGLHALDDAAPIGSRALRLEGGRITWIGADPAAAPPSHRIVDLGDAWLTPTFVDAHVHGTATGLAQRGLDLTGCSDLADALATLRRHAAQLASEPLIVLGRGWDEQRWPQRRAPTAEEVGTAAPGATVLLSRVDGHSAVVDPGTLARLPLDRLGGVERDAAGAPTGWLRDAACEAATQLVLARIPATVLSKARRAACTRAAALGIGSLHEMGHPGLSGLDDALAWSRGSHGVEVHTWWAVLDPEDALRQGLRPGGDLFLDGSIGSGTAAVSCGYADMPGLGSAGAHTEGLFGGLFLDDADVADFFMTCSRVGIGAGVHAVGDRAIEQAIGAVEAAAAALGAGRVRACRHRIEHVEMPRGDHARRMAALGIVASVQPVFDALWGGSDGLYARHFGPGAASGMNPLAGFAAAGVPLAFGSDSTVTPMDPWGAVVAAERHRGGSCLDRRTALAAHTLGGRHVAGQHDVGPLAIGMRADVAIWDGDPLQSDDPGQLRCLAMLVSGGVVHGDLSR